MNDKNADRPAANGEDGPRAEAARRKGVFGWLRGLMASRNGDSSARDTLEELIEERAEAEVPIDESERTLLANILELKGRTIRDVMVPRADIVALDDGASLAKVIKVIAKDAHSRSPVYRGNLDNTIGMIHIKDILAWRGEDGDFRLSKVLRKVLFVSPSMEVMELLLEMRAKRTHMALVVDEFGGVDGLVTIEDLVEEIVGEIEDEHDRVEEPDLIQRPDGAFDADARATLEALEEFVGPVIGEEEREDINTLGGLVFSLAGRVPIRGEIVSHPGGLEFEVLDADPRRIKRLRVRRSVARADTQAPG